MWHEVLSKALGTSYSKTWCYQSYSFWASIWLRGHVTCRGEFGCIQAC
jgi:hypothetical protein